MFIFGKIAILVFILRLFITVVIFLIKEILLSGNGLIKMGINPELRQRLIPDIICRKMLDPSTKYLSKTSTNWIEIRYAEVLLNLAEAALESWR